MLEVTKTRTAVAMLVAAAAPSASARAIDDALPAATNAGLSPTDASDGYAGLGPTNTSAGQTSRAVGSDAVTRTVEVRSSGFDWEDAGLGAAGMLSLLGLGTGAVVFGRRRRGHPTLG
jgi:hypothetical protein